MTPSKLLLHSALTLALSVLLNVTAFAQKAVVIQGSVPTGKALELVGPIKELAPATEFRPAALAVVGVQQGVAVIEYPQRRGVVERSGSRAKALVASHAVLDGASRADSKDSNTDFSEVLLGLPGGTDPLPSGDYTIRVLATEITAGPNGAPYNVKADIKINGVSTPLFNDNVLVPGATSNFTLPEVLTNFAILAKAAPPWNSNNYSWVTPSDHLNAALTLVNGDNVIDQLNAKMAQPPLGNQTSVLSILQSKGLADQNGIVTLPANAFIQTFELGTFDVNSALFDLNDLIVEITGPPVSRYFSIYDAIGANNSATNNHIAFSSYRSITTAAWGLAATTVTTPRSGILSQIDMVASTGGSNPSPSCWGAFELYVYSSFEQAKQFPTQPDRGAYILGAPLNGWVPFGTTNTGRPTYLLSFDLSALAFPVVANESLVMGIMAPTAPASCGYLTVSESAASTSSVVGWQIGANYSGGYRLLTSISGSTTGYLGLRLIAQAASDGGIPPSPGNQANGVRIGS